MAGYTIRSLTQLAAEAKSAFVQAVQGTAANLLPNVWRVESKVLSLIGFNLEMRRAWLVRQLFASTADRTWLIRHGFEYGLQPAPAASAFGSATFPVAPGTVIPAGLQFTRGDATFTTTASETAGAATISLPLEADVAGMAGNTPAGTVLTLVDPDDAPVGFTGIGTVDAASDGSGLSGGADEQALESFRAQVLYRKRNPPQGGSAADYAEWVLAAVPTATRVFVDSFQNDERSVWVQFLVSDQANGIPTSAQVAAAQAYIDDPQRRPITARVFVSASYASAVPVVIGGLSPDNADVRAAVAAEIAAVFQDRAEPGRPSTPFALSASWIDEAISRATGEDSHRLVAPAADLSFSAGFLPVPGGISYIA